ncbi:MAG TPA: hypothetical protein VFV94_12165 [Polyangiaceae bacterium]|nr:hypothetical protein [Polyangiaceae bacterium]
MRSTLRRRPVTRLAVTLLTVLRVLALILGLQLSGAAHAATEAVELIASADVRHADACPPDGPCNDCPPSCPNCHCSNAPTALTPEPVRAELIALALVPSSTPRVSERTPPSPELPLPFRPPRALVAHG